MNKVGWLTSVPRIALCQAVRVLPENLSGREPNAENFNRLPGNFMSLTDILMICATALSPLIAVQVTKYLDDINEQRDRKVQIFKTLMATRAYTLSPAHVEALNRIDLEFSLKRKLEKSVLNVWQQYLDHLGNRTMTPEAWAERRIDLLVDLLRAMGQSLGYDFNKTQIKNATYSPIAHGRIEEEQEKARQLVLELLEGKRALPMFVSNVPNQNAGEQS